MANDAALVAAVNSRLREEWGITIHSIPTETLALGIARNIRVGWVLVKVPSRSEFEMTHDEARAVLAVLRSK